MAVTVSCLHAIRNLQKLGHLKPDERFFSAYAREGLFHEVRIAAIKCLVDLLKTPGKDHIMEDLLLLVRTDGVPRVRFAVVNALVENPPFTKEGDSPLNSPQVVDALWTLTSKTICHDSQLRCECLRLFHKLFGRKRPHCLPMTDPSFNFSKGGKEKKDRKRKRELEDYPDIKIKVRKRSAEEQEYSGGGGYNQEYQVEKQHKEKKKKKKSKHKKQKKHHRNECSDFSSTSINSPYFHTTPSP